MKYSETLFGPAQAVADQTAKKPSLIREDIKKHSANITKVNNNLNRSSVNRKKGNVSASSPRDYKFEK